MFKLVFRTMMVFCFVASLAACNTVKGVGKDVKKAGEKIEETAEKHD